MSDPTEAATTGAKAATGEDSASVATETSSFGSAVSRARAKMAQTAAGVGTAASAVGAKVSDKVSDALTDDDDPHDVAHTGAGAVTGAGAATGASVGAGRMPSITRRTRKARLRLARLDPWSVMKTMFLFSIAGAIIMFVATWIVWGLVNASGVFDSINNAVNELLASPGAQNSFRLDDYINGRRLLGFTALIGAINVVLLTALATLFSWLYNLAASVMGGLEVTLAED
ncbi:DUF3566 domain-containing protein [Luteococcus sanguinis]|uniref:DUF3566 domain-containing protein n=1 Tax=Luteococcus sanguinis TaxID=174038 RepID=A0ABW1X3P4_9ACTN